MSLPDSLSRRRHRRGLRQLLHDFIHLLVGYATRFLYCLCLEGMRHHYHGKIGIPKGTRRYLGQPVELAGDEQDGGDTLLLGIDRIVDTPRGAGASGGESNDGGVALALEIRPLLAHMARGVDFVGGLPLDVRGVLELVSLLQ